MNFELVAIYFAIANILSSIRFEECNIYGAGNHGQDELNGCLDC